MPCGNPCCYNLPRRGQHHCSRACAMRMVRARQPREVSSAIGRAARQAQDLRDIRALLARVRLQGQTEEQRILLAWRLGRRAAKSERYRQRQRSAA